ncbi:hypothetical protein [Tenacibaculum sp. 190524A02b]|uniref:hypothetical protein n=1 Tax=Tenacibaculum vairaonense TaxID=3137860 RepID=UPI0031FB3A6E
MATITRHKEIYENTIYSWECPICKEFNDTYENPNLKDELCCDGCNEEIKVIGEDE